MVKYVYYKGFMAPCMDKTPENILQQEIIRERAAVLGRAGESVDRALAKLCLLEKSIDRYYRELLQLDTGYDSTPAGDLSALKTNIIRKINKDIHHYNRLREHAQLRYHYLIITREALGLRRHQRVEELYAIPPKKRQIEET